MKHIFSKIKSLKKGDIQINLPFANMEEFSQAYFSFFIRKRKYKIGDFTINNHLSILKQFETEAPCLAEYGLIQIALSYYANRYIVNVYTGLVFSCESSIIANDLYEWWKGGKKEEINLLVEKCAVEVFDNLPQLFEFIENESRAVNS